MLPKLVIVFLGVMVLIAMIGSKLFPGALSRRLKNTKKGGKVPVCGQCGRYVIGRGACACSKKG